MPVVISFVRGSIWDQTSDAAVNVVDARLSPDHSGSLDRSFREHVGPEKAESQFRALLDMKKNFSIPEATVCRIPMMNFSFKGIHTVFIQLESSLSLQLSFIAMSPEETDLRR